MGPRSVTNATYTSRGHPAPEHGARPRHRARHERAIEIDLAIETLTEEQRTILRVTGELDLFTAPRLREAVVEATEAGVTNVIVNLDGVSFIDSSGLGVLVACLKRLRERDGSFAVVAGETSSLHKLLALTGLDGFLPTFTSLEAARSG
ncbi:MAG TPA: STAS domain-containing protein [Actinomycetota bacterium]|jgi:anti-sigma B factor antagonist|nr:STAS domain-containing protein [Actinomycetota bacterium]